MYICLSQEKQNVYQTMNEMEFNKAFLEKLLEQAKDNPLLRYSYDLGSSLNGISTGQSIKLNALLPGTVVPIHQHNDTDEIVFCLCGKLDKVIYEEVVSYENLSSENFKHSMDAQDVTRKVEYREVQRIHLCPAKARYGCQILKGAWHTVEVIEPSVIFEAKDRMSKTH